MTPTSVTTFACGMPHPWRPSVPYPQYIPPVVSVAPQCDHCFCLESDVFDKMGKPEEWPKHLKCCKCSTLMAEKFVDAWFKILKPE